MRNYCIIIKIYIYSNINEPLDRVQEGLNCLVCLMFSIKHAVKDYNIIARVTQQPSITSL